MWPEENVLVNSSISTFQQGLTHSALMSIDFRCAWVQALDRPWMSQSHMILLIDVTHGTQSMDVAHGFYP